MLLLHCGKTFNFTGYSKFHIRILKLECHIAISKNYKYRMCTKLTKKYFETENNVVINALI